MYMKYSQNTIDETPCERVVFRMKEGTTNQDQLDLVNDLKDAMY